MELTIRIAPAEVLTAAERDAIFAMCARAYREDLRAGYEAFDEPVHVIGSVEGRVVTHALRTTRWLAPNGAAPLRTAYIELVATDPEFQRQGHARRIMKAVLAEAADFELAALCPSDDGQALYERLGWVAWEGPLLIRQEAGLIATPEERVLIHRLPRSPLLDTRTPLSAEWRGGELW
jgi:GNAT superfamily N-acetyltransferase